MESGVHSRLAQAAGAFIAFLDGKSGSANVEAVSAPVPAPRILPLRRATTTSLIQEIRTLGCSSNASQRLTCLIEESFGRLFDLCTHQYHDAVEHVWSWLQYEGRADGPDWIGAMSIAFQRQHDEAVTRLGSRILNEVRAAQLRHSTSPAPPPAAAAQTEPITLLSGHFNPTITSLLQSAFEAHQSDLPPNKGERRELARATGLTEKQVVTWFSNARQREKKRREKEGTATATARRSSARSQPYDIDMAPQHRRRLSAEQRYPSEMRPQQQHTGGGGGRKWSGSSALSALSSSVGSSASSLDLVEYVETAGPTFVLPDPAPAPVPAPTPASAKVQVDVSASLDPSGWFSLASPPSSLSLSPPPPALVTTPANINLPQRYEEEERFLSVPAGGPTPEAGQLASSPSAWSNSAAVSPTPSIESPSAVFMSDELPFPPTVPAASDAWMDDEFFRNLFSSVGFEMEVGIGVDGLFSDGRSADKRSGGNGGGLTLRMEDLRRDEQVMMQL